MRQALSYSGEGLRRPVAFKEQGDSHAFVLNPFIPNIKLIKAINTALKTGWPLLIRGEKFRRDRIGKAIAYELYGADFLPHYFTWTLRHQISFQDGLYTYAHADRQRDLIYSQADPVNNPVKKPEDYLMTGPLLPLYEYMQSAEKLPILEIRNTQEGGEWFIEDMMDFLIFQREIRIPETGYRVEKGFTFPIIILTSDINYQLPSDFEGIIYEHEISVPSQEELLAELLPIYEDSRNEEGQLLSERPDYPELKALIEKLVKLFYLIKDSGLLRPKDSQFPMSTLELKDSISLKINEVTNAEKSVAESLQELDDILAAQYEMAASMDISESVRVMREAVKVGEVNSAIKSLDLLKDRLPKEKQTIALQLISRHNQLKKNDQLGIESPLILYPQKNKLTFDLSQFLLEL